MNLFKLLFIIILFLGAGKSLQKLLKVNLSQNKNRKSESMELSVILTMFQPEVTNNVWLWN